MKDLGGGAEHEDTLLVSWGRGNGPGARKRGRAGRGGPEPKQAANQAGEAGGRWGGRPGAEGQGRKAQRRPSKSFWAGGVGGVVCEGTLFLP